MAAAYRRYRRLTTSTSASPASSRTASGSSKRSTGPPRATATTGLRERTSSSGPTSASVTGRWTRSSPAPTESRSSSTWATSGVVVASPSSLPAAVDGNHHRGLLRDARVDQRVLRRGAAGHGAQPHRGGLASRRRALVHDHELFGLVAVPEQGGGGGAALRPEP